VHRITERLVCHRKEKRHHKQCEYDEPAEPCKRKHSRKDPAFPEAPTRGEISPVNVDIWWIAGAGGDAGPNYPEEEENEQRNKFRGERVDETVLEPAVDRTGNKWCPKECENARHQELDDDRVIELDSIVQ